MLKKFALHLLACDCGQPEQHPTCKPLAASLPGAHQLSWQLNSSADTLPLTDQL
jgi:hypothetical protein